MDSNYQLIEQKQIKFLAFCDSIIESLDPQHKNFCEEVGKYVPPLRRYVDDDGTVHDPNYRLPTHNPENYTRSGIYKLKFNEMWKEPGFREFEAKFSLLTF
jgi:hypothetical protein